MPRIRRLLGRSGTAQVKALTGINLVVEQGEIFGLVGRNGQGKTTLIKCIAGLVEPNRGWARVLGHHSTLDSLAVKTSIGLVTAEERSFYWRLSGWQNLMFFARLHGLDDAAAKRRIGEILDSFNLGEYIDRPFHDLSTGYKQRMAIARSLLADPRVLILDEPTKSLDPMAAVSLRQVIRDWMHAAEGRAIFITSNNLSDVEQLCGRVGILNRGELKACDTLSNLRIQYSPREQVTFQVKGPNEPDGLAALARQAPGLTWEERADHLLDIQFTRETDDRTLHRVVEELVNSGFEIISCETTRLDLKDVMERIERQE